MFHGSITALITPFRNGTIDDTALLNLINWQGSQGTTALVVCGSTGEGALLTAAERAHLCTKVIVAAKEHLPIIVGCGAPSTQQTLEQAFLAQQAGASALLLVSPYYSKPSPEGLYEHFKTIHNATSLPILLYNNPGRTKVNLAIPLIVKLSQLPRIVGLKDSHPETYRLAALRQAIQKPFSLLAGDDVNAAASLANGADGWVSITANVAPHACQQVVAAWHAGDMTTFKKLWARLYPLCEAIALETNPIPVKAAAAQLSLCSNELRLPLLSASASTEAAIQQALGAL